LEEWEAKEKEIKNLCFCNTGKRNQIDGEVYKLYKTLVVMRAEISKEEVRFKSSKTPTKKYLKMVKEFCEAVEVAEQHILIGIMMR
jgi:hypothetical protein